MSESQTSDIRIQANTIRLTRLLAALVSHCSQERIQEQFAIQSDGLLNFSVEKAKNNLTCKCLDCGRNTEKNTAPGGNPRRDGENIRTPYRKDPQPPWNQTQDLLETVLQGETAVLGRIHRFAVIKFKSYLF